MDYPFELNSLIDDEFDLECDIFNQPMTDYARTKELEPLIDY